MGVLIGSGVYVGAAVGGTEVGASVETTENMSVGIAAIVLLTLENVLKRMKPTNPRIKQVMTSGTITLTAVTPSETPAVTFVAVPILLEISSLIVGMAELKSL